MMDFEATRIADADERTAYAAFVRRHWGRHEKVGPEPDTRVFKAMASFANVVSAVACTFAAGKRADRDTFIACMGVMGEAGEIVEHLKKHVRDGVLDLDKLRLEVGDALFYLTRIAQFEDPPLELLGYADAAMRELIDALGFTYAEIAQANIEKLEARYGV